MEVYIDKQVQDKIEQFYESALLNHETLDEITVNKKMIRLYEALEHLGTYAYIYPKARLKKSWIDAGYREYICEDFHFAYSILFTEVGLEVVRVHDVVHSMMYME